MSREKSFLSLPLFINLNSAPLSARPPSSSPCLPCHGLLYRTPRSLAPVLFWHLITPNSDYLMFRRRYLTSRRGTHVIHLIQRPASSTLSANYSLSCKNIIFKVLIYSFFFPSSSWFSPSWLIDNCCGVAALQSAEIACQSNGVGGGTATSLSFFLVFMSLCEVVPLDEIVWIPLDKFDVNSGSHETKWVAERTKWWKFIKKLWHLSFFSFFGYAKRYNGVTLWGRIRLFAFSPRSLPGVALSPWGCLATSEDELFQHITKRNTTNAWFF